MNYGPLVEQHHPVRLVRRRSTLAMEHSIRIHGPHFALRPIALDDAALIVELRTDTERSRFMHAIAPDVAAQTAFLQAYLARLNDYYFVVESRQAGTPEGLISLYNIDPAEQRGEAGRWILRPNSLAAVESVWLAYRVAIEQLALREVFCLTLADNQRVVSFHESCGLERRGLRPRDVQIHDQWHDRIEHVLTRERWPAVSRKLERLASCVM